MGYPENPETIILKNKFYPKGLKEIDVWNYYQKAKSLILNEVGVRDLMFAIMVDINKPVIRRKTKDGKYIKLSNATYDKLITGRTITIYSTMRMFEEIAIVDIDTDNFNQAKTTTLDIYDALTENRMIHKLQIRHTGKNSFHILVEFKRKLRIDTARIILEQFLSGTDISKKYTIAPKRTGRVPNIDLWASNKVNGAFITLHSLSIWGLRCVAVPYSQVRSFNLRTSTIRI